MIRVMVLTALLAPAALAYIVLLESDGGGTLFSQDAGHVALLVGGGITTAVPLILFGAAAIRVPLSTLGILQYLGPILQFLIGVLLYSEPMPASRLAGFALVWVALAVFTWDAVRGSRRARFAAAGEPGGEAPAEGTCTSDEPALGEAPAGARL
jgi:chloramphenicol-sensitive protein RarD